MSDLNESLASQLQSRRRRQLFATHDPDLPSLLAIPAS